MKFEKRTGVPSAVAKTRREGRGTTAKFALRRRQEVLARLGLALRNRPDALLLASEEGSAGVGEQNLERSAPVSVDQEPRAHTGRHCTKATRPRRNGLRPALDLGAGLELRLAVDPAGASGRGSAGGPAAARLRARRSLRPPSSRRIRNTASLRSRWWARRGAAGSSP